MSTRNAPPRPRQVTTAGVMGVVGSVLLVFSLFDALGRVRSVEMRSEVEEFLSAPPGNGLGLSSDAVLDALHGMVLLNGALAAAAAVLAVYVFQRHQAARVGFTVAAALLLFTAPVSGGLMAMVVAFAATMLWSRPARDWFAGRQPAPAFAEQRPDRSGEPGPSRAEWPPPASRPADSGPPLPPPPAQAPARPSPSEAPPAQTPPAEVPAAWTRPGSAEEAATPPPASYPFGTRPDPSWAPPGVGQQPGVPAWAVGTRQDPDRRPGGVTLAAVLSWVFAGATALAFLLVVLMLMFARQDLVDAIQADPQFESLPMSTDDLLAALWVMSAVCLFWSVSALVLAALAFRRLGWARYALVGSAAMTLLVSLLAFPFGLLHAAAAVVTIAMLLGRRASAWYARRPADLPPGGYGGPSAPGYGGPSAPGPYGGPPAPPPADQNPPPPQSGGDQGVPPAPPYPPPGRKQKPPVW